MYRKHYNFTVLIRIWSCRKLNYKWSLGTEKGQAKDYGVRDICILYSAINIQSWKIWSSDMSTDVAITAHRLHSICTCAECSLLGMRLQQAAILLLQALRMGWFLWLWPVCHQLLTCNGCDCPIPAQQHPLFGHCTSSPPSHCYSNLNIQFHSLSCSTYPYMLLQCLCSI